MSEISKYEERLAIYDRLVEQSADFDRKGKTMPYTSANGHMFSQLNKNGELGIRFSKEIQQTYFEKFNTSYYISYGAKMNGYILVTDEMWKDENLIFSVLHESFTFVMSLPAK